jgi:hypothetical protein
VVLLLGPYSTAVHVGIVRTHARRQSSQRASSRRPSRGNRARVADLSKIGAQTSSEDGSAAEKPSPPPPSTMAASAKRFMVEYNRSVLAPGVELAHTT